MNSNTRWVCAVCIIVATNLLAVEFATAQQEFQFSVQQLKFGGQANFAKSVSYTENVSQTVEVLVPFTEYVSENYTVQIPFTEYVTQNYTVQVPYEVTVTASDGSKKEIEKTKPEQRTRTIPVQKMRTETRTRQVPVKRKKIQTQTKLVPVTKVRVDTFSEKFPKANAKFAYVSGKEISHEELRTLAATEIPILKLPPGHKLSELHRTVFKPDLIVMMFPTESE